MPWYCVPVTSISIFDFTWLAISAQPEDYRHVTSDPDEATVKRFLRARKGDVTAAVAQWDSLIYTCLLGLSLGKISSPQPAARSPQPAFQDHLYTNKHSYALCTTRRYCGAEVFFAENGVRRAGFLGEILYSYSSCLTNAFGAMLSCVRVAYILFLRSRS